MLGGPLLLQFGGEDKRVNATWPDYEALLIKNEARYTAHFYAGAKHGFHNDSTGRYSPEDAELAWLRTLAFFSKELAR